MIYLVNEAKIIKNILKMIKKKAHGHSIIASDGIPAVSRKERQPLVPPRVWVPDLLVTDHDFGQVILFAKPHGCTVRIN